MHIPVEDEEIRPIHLPASLSKLPPFPRIALRALKELSKDDLSVSKLQELLASDVVFASSALHCANSALFGLMSRVVTLHHAIVVLGRDRLRCLILTTALRSFSNAPLRSKDFRAWWHHSLATAILSEALASASGNDCPEAYMAGLLHDVGRLGMILQLSREQWRAFERMTGASSRAGRSILEMEREIFGTDHCAIGQRLLQDWGIPQELIQAAAVHHEPQAASGSRSALFVAASCAMASRAGFAALNYLRSGVLEELAPLMPVEARPMLAADPENLHAALELKIKSIDVK